jgi:hypothetical protein
MAPGGLCTSTPLHRWTSKRERSRCSGSFKLVYASPGDGCRLRRSRLRATTLFSTLGVVAHATSSSSRIACF